MHVTLRYIDGCPHWRAADERIRAALTATGHGDVTVTREVVGSADEADRLGFVGSPTVLVDGVDPFAVAGSPSGLACRVYTSSGGPSGAPTAQQLEDVFRSLG